MGLSDTDMNILVDWYDPSCRIIVERIGYHWSWEEWDQALGQLYSLAQSVDPGAILISEVPGDVSLPPGGFSDHMRNALACHADCQLNAVIYAIRNPTLRMLWQEAIERYAHPAIEYRFVNSLDDGLALAQAAV